MKHYFNPLKTGMLALLILAFYSCENSIVEEEVSFTDDTVVDAATKKQNSKLSFNLEEDCSTNQSLLYAGQNILVGNVTVSEEAGMYSITYNITNSSYCLAKTHLSVVETPSDFPINGGGNPVNGHFEYSESHDCLPSYTYSVPSSKGTYIAAHAEVVCKVVEDIYDIEADLPDTVELCVTSKGVDEGSSYFIVDFNDANFSGEYEAWCLDVAKKLEAGDCITAGAFSSYEELPSGYVDAPDNLPLINWLINQNLIGATSPSGGTYTFGDVQWAIWELIDNYNCTACSYLGTNWSETKGQELVDLAKENGVEFVPECGEKLAVVLIPSDDSQPICISLEIECEMGECEETAWAEGCDFPGNNWATYFQYAAGL